MRANRTLFLAIFGLLLLLTACAKRVHLKPAMSVPAAAATAEITHDSNGNTVVTLDVKHLARPENLTPPESAEQSASVSGPSGQEVLSQEIVE